MEIILLKEQCRAARAIQGWSQAELAKAANVSRQTIADFERGAHVPISNNLAGIVSAFRAVGIEFIFDKEGDVYGIKVKRSAE